MFESSEFWLIVLVVIAMAGAVIRWVVLKSSGKELPPNETSVVLQLRTQIVKALTVGVELITIEKESGREGVRAEIARRIKVFIQETELFTEDEKALLHSVNMTYLVKVIETELIRLRVIKEELDAEHPTQ